MKKILFFAGLLAFVTSCTDDELISSGSYNQELPNGISFSTTFAEMPESRGMLTFDEAAQNFPFFWYAEQDSIKIYPFGEVKKGDAYLYGENGTWNNAVKSGLAYAAYKATQSKSDGKFTSINNADLLVFADSTNVKTPGATAHKDNSKNAQATFAATYNATIDSIFFDATTKGVKRIVIKPAKQLATADANGVYVQDLTEGKNVTQYMPMYGVTPQVTQEEEYSSVGESVDMKFYRHGAILGFQTSGIDETYSKLFGKLDSIEVKMCGGDSINPSVLAYNGTQPSYDITIGAANDFTKSKINDTAISNSANDSIHAITAVYKKEWSDDDIAYVAIAPVNRNGKAEKYVVRYVFENISFITDTITTTSNWASATNGVVKMNKAKLDMSEKDFLVVKNPSGTKSLLVNSGNFASVFAKDTLKLAWDGAPAVTEIDTLISKVAMTEADMKTLARFTSLKYIQLDEATTLPKGALNASGLKYINMPKVATIAEDFSAVAITPETVLLPAYKYDVKKVNDALIKVGLKKIDITGVTKVEETFYTPNVLTFNGISSLTEVKLNNLKVEVPNFFKGCTDLEKVDGVIDITNAPGVFNNVDSLVTVNITGTVIPNEAFWGAKKITNILVDSVQVLPTTIGESAFYECVALTTMDLKNTTTIGNYAFFGSSLAKATKDVALMTVGATTIGDKAFGSTALTQVDFVNATSIGDAILINTPSTSVQFQKAFTVDETRVGAWTDGGFGSTSTLYVANGQKYVESNTLKLPYKTSNAADATTAYTTYYFTTIRVAAAQ